MYYKACIDYGYKGIRLYKYTNKDIKRDEYLIYRNEKGLRCDCFKFQREGNCKHIKWLRILLL